MYLDMLRCYMQMRPLPFFLQRALGHDNNDTTTEGHVPQSYADRMFGIADLMRRGRTAKHCSMINKVGDSTVYMSLQVYNAVKGAIKCYRQDNDREGGALVAAGFYNKQKPGSADDSLTKEIYKTFLQFVYAAGSKDPTRPPRDVEVPLPRLRDNQPVYFFSDAKAKCRLLICCQLRHRLARIFESKAEAGGLLSSKFLRKAGFQNVSSRAEPGVQKLAQEILLGQHDLLLARMFPYMNHRDSITQLEQTIKDLRPDRKGPTPWEQSIHNQVFASAEMCELLRPTFPDIETTSAQKISRTKDTTSSLHAFLKDKVRFRAFEAISELSSFWVRPSEDNEEESEEDDDYDSEIAAGASSSSSKQLKQPTTGSPGSTSSGKGEAARDKPKQTHGRTKKAGAAPTIPTQHTVAELVVMLSMHYSKLAEMALQAEKVTQEQVPSQWRSLSTPRGRRKPEATSGAGVLVGGNDPC